MVYQQKLRTFARCAKGSVVLAGEDVQVSKEPWEMSKQEWQYFAITGQLTNAIKNLVEYSTPTCIHRPTNCRIDEQGSNKNHATERFIALSKTAIVEIKNTGEVSQQTRQELAQHIPIDIILDSNRQHHIRGALRDGKKIPIEILTEFPDLTRRYETFQCVNLAIGHTLNIANSENYPTPKQILSKTRFGAIRRWIIDHQGLVAIGNTSLDCKVQWGTLYEKEYGIAYKPKQEITDTPEPQSEHAPCFTIKSELIPILERHAIYGPTIRTSIIGEIIDISTEYLVQGIGGGKRVYHSIVDLDITTALVHGKDSTQFYKKGDLLEIKYTNDGRGKVICRNFDQE